jgi:hypothetical protein
MHSCSGLHGCAASHAWVHLYVEDEIWKKSGFADSGKPYWLVKNEWSEYWGLRGYIKIDMHHDCAASAEAFFVELQ